MKRKHNPNPPKTPQSKQESQIELQQPEDNQNALLSRLAAGSKASVDKRAMKQLTGKNYAKLPEILKRKEEEKQKVEMAAKRAKFAAQQKELDLRLR